MRPNEIPYANGPFPDKQSYFLGEQIKYMCLNSNDTRNRTCTTDGTWTDLGFVCGGIIYYSKLDKDHILMQHKILTYDLVDSKIKI